MVIFLGVLLLVNYIYDDSDSLLVVNDSLVICGYHQYNLKVHLTNKAKLKIRLWDGTDSTGQIILQAPLIYIHDSSIVQGTGYGYLGGTNTHPDGYGPGYGHAGVGGGGGGGGYGGAGGDGGDLDPGTGGISYGNASDTVINMGSGGAAGRLGSVDGFGGNGGALVYLKGHRIIIDSSSVLSNGMRGYDGGYEAGGAGSGGGIKIQTDTIRIRYASVLANGGAGGDAAGGGGGGAGGGRIKIFCSILDTLHLSLSVSGGAGGTGGNGNGENGVAGTIFFGPLVALEELCQDKPPIIIQPGITNGRLMVYSATSKKNLLIYDARGRFIKKAKLSGQVDRIDISELQNGVYFIRIPDLHSFIKIILIK